MRPICHKNRLSGQFDSENGERGGGEWRRGKLDAAEVILQSLSDEPTQIGIGENYSGYSMERSLCAPCSYEMISCDFVVKYAPKEAAS